MDNFINSLSKFNSFLEQSFWFRGFKSILGLYLIIMIIVVVMMLYRMITKYSYLKVLLGGQEFSQIKPGKFQSKWNQIEELIKSKKQNDWKVSIILASEMLNEIFEIVGYKGDNLGEKLKSLNKNQLNNVDQVKKANEVKNNIIRDERFQIEHEDALEVINIFKKALQSFEAVN